MDSLFVPVTTSPQSRSIVSESCPALSRQCQPCSDGASMTENALAPWRIFRSSCASDRHGRWSTRRASIRRPDLATSWLPIMGRAKG